MMSGTVKVVQSWNGSFLFEDGRTTLAVQRQLIDGALGLPYTLPEFGDTVQTTTGSIFHR
jgi:hypothetical protein